MINVNEYLQSLQSQLTAESNWWPILLDSRWIAEAPDTAGVYALRLKKEKIVIYVGETGNIQGRVADLTKTVNHSCRRSIGKKQFSSLPGYIPATTSMKFPQAIETMLDEYMKNDLEIAYLPVALGRKELEEMIEKELHLDHRLNVRGQRQGRRKKRTKS